MTFCPRVPATVQPIDPRQTVWCLYLLFQLLQRPSRDALPGLSALTADPEGTLCRGPHAFGDRSVNKMTHFNHTVID